MLCIKQKRERTSREGCKQFMGNWRDNDERFCLFQ